MKNYRWRIYFRTLRFVAFYWGPPFLFGILVGVLDHLYFSVAFFEAFDLSFQRAIQSCGQ